ncbi:MAG: DUF4129 domain-containing protein [Terracidiphilus sp.]
MNLDWPGSGCQATARSAAALALIVWLAAGPTHARTQDFTSNAGWRDVTVAQYQQHLKDLDAIAAACQKQRSDRSGASAAQTNFPACDPAQIGPDDRVHGFAAVPSQSREVRYDWLRSVLARAAKKGGTEQKTIFGAMPRPNNKSVSLDSLLAATRQRLLDDAAEAGAPPAPAPNFSEERESLNAILSERAYQGVTQVSTMDRLREWFDNLLDKFFSGLVRFGSHAPWIVWLLRILLLVAICTALVWFLIRIERRSRFRLVPEIELATGAPSAREWQLWYQDAGAMAAKGQWREAIHFLYWAAIARLESKGLWPADRARTPREYLTLLAATDPRKTNLAALTRSFERTWYGGRESTASDFHAALDIVRELGVAAE